MKTQLLAIIIATGVSGCAGFPQYSSGPESDAHYAARMSLIGAYLNNQRPQPMPVMPFQRQGINVYHYRGY